MSDLSTASIGEVLDAAAARAPSQPAIVVDGIQRTFQELRERAHVVAGQLHGLGVRRGDHVACLLPNSVEFAEVFYGVTLLGAVLVPINTWYRQDEFEYVLAQSDARMLIALDAFQATSYTAMIATAVPEVTDAGSRTGVSCERFPMLRTVVTIGSDVPAGAYSYSELIDRGLASWDWEPATSRSAPALVMYTSGTTSFPKGAVLPVDGVVTDAVLFGARLELREGAKYYCPAPFFHAGGAIFVLLAGHAYGCTVVSNGRFTPRAAVDSIVDQGCEFMGAFDTMYLKILDEAGGATLPLKKGWWATGSANAFRTVEEKLGLQLMNLYGMTEACGNVSCTLLDWDVEARSSSQGLPLPGREVHVLDPETQDPVEPGVTGEICVSGWGLMLGYYRLPSETAAALDDSGRLHSGDLGYLDEAGALHFVGRLKEMLKVGGENVSTREIEDLYYQHPDVAEVAVVGQPDDLYGEKPVAVIRLRSSGTASEQDLVSFAKERLASFKVPGRIVFVEDFPRSSSTGKVRKLELAASLVSDS